MTAPRVVPHDITTGHAVNITMDYDQYGRETNVLTYEISTAHSDGFADQGVRLA